MDPATLIKLLATNGSDVKAIIDLIGLDNLFKMAPHLMTIMRTLEQQKEPK